MVFKNHPTGKLRVSAFPFYQQIYWMRKLKQYYNVFFVKLYVLTTLLFSGISIWRNPISCSCTKYFFYCWKRNNSIDVWRCLKIECIFRQNFTILMNIINIILWKHTTHSQSQKIAHWSQIYNVEIMLFVVCSVVSFSSRYCWWETVALTNA